MDLYKVGQFCAQCRRRRGKTQVQVSMSMDYSPENISAFENGRTNNMFLLLWYMVHLFTADEITELMEAVRDGKINC